MCFRRPAQYLLSNICFFCFLPFFQGIWTQFKYAIVQAHFERNSNHTKSFNVSNTHWCRFKLFDATRISRSRYQIDNLTKSLCKSLLRCGEIFIAPMNMKNNPNKIDKLLSTTDELTVCWLSAPVGGGWAFCALCDVVIVKLFVATFDLSLSFDSQPKFYEWNFLFDWTAIFFFIYSFVPEFIKLTRMMLIFFIYRSKSFTWHWRYYYDYTIVKISFTDWTLFFLCHFCQ